MGKKRSVLCVDSKQDELEQVQEKLEQDGFSVTGVRIRDRAVRAAPDFDCVLISYRDAQQENGRIKAELKMVAPRVPVFEFTGTGGALEAQLKFLYSYFDASLLAVAQATPGDVDGSSTP